MTVPGCDASSRRLRPARDRTCEGPEEDPPALAPKPGHPAASPAVTDRAKIKAIEHRQARRGESGKPARPSRRVSGRRRFKPVGKSPRQTRRGRPSRWRPPAAEPPRMPTANTTRPAGQVTRNAPAPAKGPSGFLHFCARDDAADNSPRRDSARPSLARVTSCED